MLPLLLCNLPREVCSWQWGDGLGCEFLHLWLFFLVMECAPPVALPSFATISAGATVAAKLCPFSSLLHSSPHPASPACSHVPTFRYFDAQISQMCLCAEQGIFCRIKVIQEVFWCCCDGLDVL